MADRDPHWWRAEFERQLQEVIASGYGHVSVEVVGHEIKWVKHEARRNYEDVVRAAREPQRAAE